MSNTEKEHSTKQFLKQYVPIFAFFFLIGLFIFYQVFFGIYTNESQFEYAINWIDRNKFECGEGFDGFEYGYTGEIFYRHSIIGSSPTLAPLIPNTLTDEQIQQFSDMLLSKLQTLPCYEKYSEISQQSQP